MPLQATSGAASQDAFGGNGVAVVPNYIEDVFSTYLYTGNGSTQTITNGIDLSTKGGLVWIKDRTTAGQQHNLIDTVRGPTNRLSSNSTGASSNDGGAPSFNSNGFTVVANSSGYTNSGDNFASWTFREQAKFFDVVTWTGNGVATGRDIAHSLGCQPAVIIVKQTSGSGGPWSYSQFSGGNAYWLRLNETGASNFSNATGGYASAQNATSTVFTVQGQFGVSQVNTSGETYVAYLFAHNAGGFGLTGTDNVISCGSFTTDGSGNATVTLGYEPQWVLFKASSRVLNWSIHDTMRGMPVGSVASGLYPNLADAESNNVTTSPTATGFTWSGYANETFVYVAIRRGPMKVPTTGTSVFSPVARTGTGAIVNVTTPNFAPDLLFSRDRGSSAAKFSFNDKLRGPTLSLYSTDTAAEVTTTGLTSFNNLGYTAPADGLSYNEDGDTMITECFQRAQSFMDVVCYTGTGTVGQTFNHNLGVVPELMIVKCRTNSDLWPVYSATLGPTKFIALNTGVVTTTAGAWNNTAPTASVFSVGANSYVNFDSSRTYVAYLFATCAGVSKVGSYTGTATTQQINCGFTTGARFVMIVRTDSTGDWYVWDSARGIVAGNDPYLLLNSTAAEVTNTDYIDTYSAGFEISSTAPAAINASGGTYIFLAIA